MGHAIFKNENKRISIHDSDFFQNGKFIKCNGYLVAKFDFLGGGTYVLAKMKVKIKYRHSGYCADDAKLKRRIRKIFKKIEIPDIHGFLSCQNQAELLDKMIIAVEKSKDQFMKKEWLEILNKKELHNVWRDFHSIKSFL